MLNRKNTQRSSNKNELILTITKEPYMNKHTSKDNKVITGCKAEFSVGGTA